MQNSDQPTRREHTSRRRDAGRPARRFEPTPEIGRPDIESGAMTSEKLGRVQERLLHTQDTAGEETAVVTDANEDRAYRNDVRSVYAVFDGVGGYAGGRVAASRAVEILAETVDALPKKHSLYAYRALAEQSLRRVFTRASAAIAAEQAAARADAVRARTRGDDALANQLESQAHMATTAAVVHVLRDTVTREPYEALIAHLGDSRVAVLRGGEIAWRTADHSAIQERIDAGALPPEADQVGDVRGDAALTAEQQEEVLRDRNVITSAIDGTATPVTFAYVPLEAGDLLLLTTDGIHDNLTDREIAVLTAPYANNPEAAARVLHEEARRRSIEAFDQRPNRSIRAKDDDITAVVVRINEAQPRAKFSAHRGDTRNVP